MLAKTNGIVISTIKFRETSIIARVFTEKFGLQSYLVNGIRSAKGKFKIALFQPLTILELIVYHKDNGGIQRLSEVKCSYQYRSITGNMMKSTLLIFINEILEKTLREGSNPEEVYPFLVESLIKLDAAEKDPLNFHLEFLIGFAAYLGFAPQSIKNFRENIPARYKDLNKKSYKLIESLIGNFSSDQIDSDNESRRIALDLLLIYYNSNIESFSNVKSTAILREILS